MATRLQKPQEAPGRPGLPGRGAGAAGDGDGAPNQPQVTMSFRQLGKAFARHLAGRRLLTQVNLWGAGGANKGACHCQLLSEFGYN